MLDRIKNGDLVWAILREEEKIALSLQLVEGKSSWQAGEIMGKSHYKYLEIFNRAKEFVRIFSHYFSKYDEICPSILNIPKELKPYFRYLIGERGRIVEASKDFTGYYRKPAYRNNEIIKAFKKLSQSPYEVEQEWISMVLHFDKWNNFRILPKEVQEPHAFKRRNKNRYKGQIKQFINIPRYSKNRLLEVIEINLAKKKGEPIYFYLMEESDEGYHIELIEAIDVIEITDLLNALYIYYFRNEAMATEYIKAITSQVWEKQKTCKEGLEFWPKYRALIRHSLNYDAQQSIIPGRKYYDLMQRDNFELREYLQLRGLAKIKDLKER